MEMEKPAILIVDDMPSNIFVLSEALNDEYEVLFATSGSVALQTAEREMPDMILLDIMMPQMDGYEVCAKLKENPTTQHIPVIFVTARDRVDDETKGLDLGAIDYLTKPVRPAILKARVRNHLERKHALELQEKLVKELQEALSRIKMLTGLLPICSGCKKIRADDGSWTEIESYVRTHSDAEFTHGLCPICRKELYPDVFDD